ncbi:DUF4870 domain-containing protein [Demequina flava]|uniref:DUF4870 domain-containing protein n=1 Tax=Demequina flava TaxID=1095025 RepID=UPI00078035CC|nr:DUF4870 domain-containing protein [Demequina flava]
MTENNATPPPPPEENSNGQAQQPAASGSNPNLMPALANLTVFTGFLLPLIFWLVSKDQSPFADKEGKNALNFGILITIGYLVSTIIGIIPIIGLLSFVIWLAVLVVGVIFGIQAFQAVNKGNSYKFPFNIELVK